MRTAWCVVGVLAVAMLLCSVAEAQSCNLDGMWRAIDSNSTDLGTQDGSWTMDFSWTGSYTGQVSLDIAAGINCTYTVEFEGTYELDESDTLTLASDSCNYFNCGGNCTAFCEGFTCDADNYSVDMPLTFNDNCTSFTSDGEVFYKQNSGDSDWWVYAMIGFAGLMVVAISVGLVVVVIYMVVKKKRGDYLTVDEE